MPYICSVESNKLNYIIMKTLEIYRNIPYVDNKGKLFHFQKSGRRIWIELPFIGITFRLYNNY